MREHIRLHPPLIQAEAAETLDKLSNFQLGCSSYRGAKSNAVPMTKDDRRLLIGRSIEIAERSFDVAEPCILKMLGEHEN